MNSFAVVEQFEASVAKFAGSKYAVAVNTGTSALFLSMKFMYSRAVSEVTIPARTFISVPMAAVHAGYKVNFVDQPWQGVYTIDPIGVVDGALRFRKNMYQGGMHCLSFHARKLLNIGEGGMVLMDSEDAYKWLKKARYSGRDVENGYRIEDVAMIGFQAYMTPEKAARGLHLMDYVEDWPDQVMQYEDLRKCPVFHA